MQGMAGQGYGCESLCFLDTPAISTRSLGVRMQTCGHVWLFIASSDCSCRAASAILKSCEKGGNVHHKRIEQRYGHCASSMLQNKKSSMMPCKFGLTLGKW